LRLCRQYRRQGTAAANGFACRTWWYCPKCGALLHQAELQVRDIVSDLPPVFEAFYHDENARTCPCGRWPRTWPRAPYGRCWWARPPTRKDPPRPVCIDVAELLICRAAKLHDAGTQPATYKRSISTLYRVLWEQGGAGAPPGCFSGGSCWCRP
jgi:hypothetical protein